MKETRLRPAAISQLRSMLSLSWVTLTLPRSPQQTLFGASFDYRDGHG
jgi:hypothetical protein